MFLPKRCLGSQVGSCDIPTLARNPVTLSLSTGHTSLCTMSFPWDAMELP